jgi:hypothetical protein
MPTRALQPGQSATISPVKPNINQRVDMGDYINDFSDKKIELRRLEKQLTQSYPGIDQTTTKTRIDKLKKEMDPKTYGYDQLIKHIVPVIKSRCSDFLPILQKHGFLYRGTQKALSY